MPVVVLFFCALVYLESSSSNESAFTVFNDLGNLLLGGFVLAVVVAIAFTFVRLRLREKKPPPAQFISISFDKKE